jgi:tetratricopeptide (TPR) repeat protein
MAMLRISSCALLCLALLSGACAAQTPQFDAWFAADDFVAVEREAARLLARDPADRTALLARARLGLADADSNRLAPGIEAMEQCLARNEADAGCHLLMGGLLGRKAIEAGMVSGLRYAGRIREHFERAVALAPRSIEARHSLNQFFILAPAIAGGGKTRARENIASFARLEPAQAALLRAQLDIAQERFAEAETALLGYRGGTDGEAADVWQQELASLGYRHLSAKPPRLAEAQRVMDFAAVRFPRSELFRRGQGRVAQEQGRYEAAAAHFESALAIRPQPGAHYRLAQVAERLGDTARAITHYEKTLRFSSGVPRSVLSDANERLKTLGAR